MPVSRGRKGRGGKAGKAAENDRSGPPGGFRVQDLSDPVLASVLDNVDDSVRACFASDVEMGRQIIATGFDKRVGLTHEGADLEESVPVAKFEPAKSVVMRSAATGLSDELQVKAAVALGLQRWLGSGTLTMAEGWQVVRTPVGLELRDPSGYVFSRGELVVPPSWVSAAVSHGYVHVVYGCKVGVRVPPSQVATPEKYRPEDRWTELRDAQRGGIVAAGLAVYVNNGTPGPNPPKGRMS